MQNCPRQAGVPKFLVMLLAVCFCLSCSPKGKNNTLKTIRFAFQNRIGSAIPIVAAEMEYFKQQGIIVEPLRFNSGPACAEALVSGSADIGTMGDSTAVIAVSRYDNLKIIASHSTGEHRHRLMVRNQSPFQMLDDLLGKRIAVKKGTSTHGGLLAVLIANRLSPADMVIVDLSPDIMPDALMAGSVDAIAASEPTPSSTELKGGRELITFGGLGNQYPILILVRDSFMNEREKDVRHFLLALRSAGAYIKAHPDETTALLGETTGLPQVVARVAMERHDYLLRLDETIVLSLRQTAVFLVNHQKIAAIPDLSKALTNRFLNGTLQAP